jgi:hypothetical protein
MKTLNYWYLLSNIALLTLGEASWATLSVSQTGTITETKELWGATGTPNVTGGIYSVNFSLGEQTAGYQISNSNDVGVLGYYGGRLGNWRLLDVAKAQATAIGPIANNNIQLGVPLNGQVRIDMTDQVQSATLPLGISINLMQDHLGQAQNIPIQYTVTYDPSGETFYLNPAPGWVGNSLYDISFSSAIQDLDGFTLDTPTHYRFITLLNPTQQNIIFTPVDASAAAAAGLNFSGPATSELRVNVSPNALNDYSYMLLNSNPQTQPLQVDPAAIADADHKIASANGAYSTPIALKEVVAYNSQGQPVTNLSAPAQVSWPYNDNDGLVAGTNTPIRSDTLSFYVLDNDHHLWVKLPDSNIDPQTKTITTTVNRLSTFGLIGTADGAASAAYAFPVPWRPHGPNAGPGSGQTGTESDGIRFSNLPSECTIRIYTISGDLVRSIHHSDTTGETGQDKWDVLTSGGQHAASGVYLWEVQSSVDKKTGKLMVIR